MCNCPLDLTADKNFNERSCVPSFGTQVTIYMDNEELNINEGSGSGESKLTEEELELFGSELKDFSFGSSDTSEKKPAMQEKSETDKQLETLEILNEPSKKAEPKAGSGERRRHGGSQQQRRRPDAQRPRPQGSRPQGHRPQGQRPRPNGEVRRRRPDEELRRRRPTDDRQGAAKKKKKGWSKKKKAVLITVVSIVLTLALIAGVIVVLFFSYTGKINRKVDSKVNTEAPPMDSSQLVSKPDTISKEDQEKKLKEMLSKRSEPITDDKVMNILVIGEDLRDTATEERGNTDVQMLISINKESKKIVLASFLRDQYVNINGYGMNRLNSAYWHEGIKLLQDTISSYYNVHIDRYIKVNFYSFMEVVDAIGGVDIDVNADEFAAINEAIREHNKYLNNPPERDYLKQQGYQHLNGNQALAYARIREGCGDDYGRTERQREMITTIIGKMKKLSIVELDSLINKVAPQITTDISNGEIASLILNASDIMGYKVCQVQMPHFPYFKEEVINQMAVLVPDYDKCCTILLEMIYGDSTTVEQAVEKMENGTINQYTYTQGGNDQNGQDQNGYNWQGQYDNGQGYNNQQQWQQY